MAALTKFAIFVQDIGRKVHNLNADALKIMLTNTAPVPTTNTIDGDITELTPGHGYSAGGEAVPTPGWTETSGVAVLSGGNVVFTASGGSMGPFRYLVLYNSTAGSSGNRPLIGFWDYGSAVTLADTQSFAVDLSANIFSIGP